MWLCIKYLLHFSLSSGKTGINPVKLVLRKATIDSVLKMLLSNHFLKKLKSVLSYFLLLYYVFLFWSYSDSCQWAKMSNLQIYTQHTHKHSETRNLGEEKGIEGATKYKQWKQNPKLPHISKRIKNKKRMEVCKWRIR